MAYVKKWKTFLESKNSIDSLFFLVDLIKKKNRVNWIKHNEEVDWEEHSRKTTEDMLKNLEKERQEKQKKLESDFPELVKIKEEAEKLQADTFEKMGQDGAEKFKKFESEITDTEGFKAAMEVLGKFIKDVGVVKSFKMLKGFIGLMTKLSDCEKRAAKIVPKGETYYMPVLGPITGGESKAEADDVIQKIKDAISVKNLMKVITGKTDELEIEYMKKDGKESSGELKDVQIKDDGSIELTIDNDAVGEIKKDITEISNDAGGEDSDFGKTFTDIKAKSPDNAKKLLTISKLYLDPKTNDEKIKQITKIVG